MNIKLATLNARILLVTGLLLGGCTTYVADVKKDERYTKRLIETSIVWNGSGVLETHISRSHSQSVTEKDRVRARQAIGDLQSLFARNFRTMASDALVNAGVRVRQSGSAASTLLRVTALRPETECAPLGCKDSLWLQAELFDLDEGRRVRSGEFKVGAPFPATADAAVVQNFTGTLISQLKSSKLL